jgi:hypothetical protein
MSDFIDFEDMFVEGLIVTPGEILERMNEMARSVASLDNDIAATTECASDPRFGQDWEKFKIDFAAYMAEYDSWTDRMWGSAMDVADKWAEQIAGWQRRYLQVCKVSPSGINLSDNTTGDTKPPSLSSISSLTTPLIIGGVLIVGVLAAMYFLPRRK